MKNLYRFALLAAGLFISPFLFAQTNISPIISSNQTWTAAGSPYILDANAIIEEGVTVTIQPGVTISSNDVKNRIIVDGTLIAIGKKDSIITVDKARFQFTEKSGDFDRTTGRGSQFQYCAFYSDASSSGYKTIELKSTSMLVKNCKFTDCYYCIYSYSTSQDSSELYITKSVFRGITQKYGNMLSTSGSSTRVEISDCYAENVGAYPGGNCSIVKSAFKNVNSTGGLRFSSFTDVRLECNLFEGFRNTVIDVSTPSFAFGNSLIVRQNTFNGGEVLLKLSGRTTSLNTVVIEENNFMSFNENSVTVGSSSTPGKADTLNLQNNYWGTTTSSSIALGIKDFADDITIGHLIDFRNFLSSPVTTCTNGSTIGGADTAGQSGGNSSVIDIYAAQTSIYPNPASSEVTLDAGANLISTIKVVDLQGKVCMKEDVHATKHTLNISSLNNGVYLIEVSGDGFSTPKRLMVRH